MLIICLFSGFLVLWSYSESTNRHFTWKENQILLPYDLMRSVESSARFVVVVRRIQWGMPWHRSLRHWKLACLAMWLAVTSFWATWLFSVVRLLFWSLPMQVCPARGIICCCFGCGVARIVCCASSGELMLEIHWISARGSPLMSLWGQPRNCVVFVGRVVCGPF